MKPNKYTISSEKSRKDRTKKKRECLHPNCKNIAISSHVLQKNGIIKELSTNNHIYQFNTVSQFEIEKKGLFELKLIGINEAYTFPGFCNNHDTSIFQSIEEMDGIEIDLKNTARLLSYRTLCNEFRRKEITLEIGEEVGSISGIEKDFPQIKMMLNIYNEGLKHGLRNLQYFKDQFEKEINENEELWDYYICEIPYFELCISSVLNVEDENNSESIIVNNHGEILNEIFTTSVINIFPYKEKNYVMLAVHKQLNCFWSIDLFNKFQGSSITDSRKYISDLIVSRIDFWCLSEKLKLTIGDNLISKYMKIYEDSLLEHSASLSFDFNLFENTDNMH